MKILNFRGSLNLTPFYRDSIENPQFGGHKSKLFKDNFRGEFLAVFCENLRFRNAVIPRKSENQ